MHEESLFVQNDDPQDETVGTSGPSTSTALVETSEATNAVTAPAPEPQKQPGDKGVAIPVTPNRETSPSSEEEDPAVIKAQKKLPNYVRELLPHIKDPKPRRKVKKSPPLLKDLEDGAWMTRGARKAAKAWSTDTPEPKRKNMNFDRMMHDQFNQGPMNRKIFEPDTDKFAKKDTEDLCDESLVNITSRSARRKAASKSVEKPPSQSTRSKTAPESIKKEAMSDSSHDLLMDGRFFLGDSVFSASVESADDSGVSNFADILSDIEEESEDDNLEDYESAEEGQSRKKPLRHRKKSSDSRHLRSTRNTRQTHDHGPASNETGDLYSQMLQAQYTDEYLNQPVSKVGRKRGQTLRLGRSEPHRSLVNAQHHDVALTHMNVDSASHQRGPRRQCRAAPSTDPETDTDVADFAYLNKMMYKQNGVSAGPPGSDPGDDSDKSSSSSDADDDDGNATADEAAARRKDAADRAAERKAAAKKFADKKLAEEKAATCKEAESKELAGLVTKAAKDAAAHKAGPSRKAAAHQSGRGGPGDSSSDSEPENEPPEWIKAGNEKDPAIKKAGAAKGRDHSDADALNRAARLEESIARQDAFDNKAAARAVARGLFTEKPFSERTTATEEAAIWESLTGTADILAFQTLSPLLPC